MKAIAFVAVALGLSMAGASAQFPTQYTTRPQPFGPPGSTTTTGPYGQTYQTSPTPFGPPGSTTTTDNYGHRCVTQPQPFGPPGATTTTCY